MDNPGDVLKLLRQIYLTLFVAAAIGLLAAGGVSCRGKAAAEIDSGPSPDSLALVEGLRLFEEGEYERAREQLLVSAASSGSYIRAESFLYLNALEMELGNYHDARPWLERYHTETVRLLRGAADASARAAEQAARLRRRHDMLAAGALCLATVAAAMLVVRANRKKRKESACQPQVNLSPWKRYLEGAEAFARTPVYAEIAELAAQTPGRDTRVLTLVRQKALDEALALHFGEFTTALRADFPSLTAGDIKLCCLSLVPLSAFGRALCWGSTETNIVKQRKHTIKRKMSSNEHGSALFAFIFDKR